MKDEEEEEKSTKMKAAKVLLKTGLTLGVILAGVKTLQHLQKSRKKETAQKKFKSVVAKLATKETAPNKFKDVVGKVIHKDQKKKEIQKKFKSVVRDAHNAKLATEEGFSFGHSSG